jgi:ribose/xylose/arabinose/galactoside ABC-type transport system permease subunit
MADEFIKGLGALTLGTFVWMITAGWYNTPHFDEGQLISPTPENLDLYGQISVVLRDVSLWFAILGMLVFWVVIPGIRQGRTYYAEQSE